MKSIIFIAPPASGKGTLSKILEENYDYKHLSTGDCLREEIEKGNSELEEIMKTGKLLNDEIILSLVAEKISSLKGRPFILDGCPRTINQAEILTKLLKDAKVTDVIVVKLNITDNVAMERILGRVVCSCGKSYNIYNDEFKPETDGICDKCNQKLVKRTDDTEDKILIRINEYKKNIEPIVNFYNKKEILFEVDATGNIEDILKNVKGLIQDDSKRT